MAATEIRIVPMSQAHLEELARLERRCFSQPWSREGLAEELDNPQAAFYTALLPDGETGGWQVAGYAGCHNILGEGYIANVAVFPELRRQGVASALMTALCRFGEEAGLLFLTLEVRASNQGAIALYRRFGFEELGRRPRFYRQPTEDAVIMTRHFRQQVE